MKKHLLFNQSFGTEGNPNQTGKTLTPSDERAMTERKPRGEKEQLSSTCLRSASFPLSLSSLCGDDFCCTRDEYG